MIGDLRPNVQVFFTFHRSKPIYAGFVAGLSDEFDLRLEIQRVPSHVLAWRMGDLDVPLHDLLAGISPSGQDSHYHADDKDVLSGPIHRRSSSPDPVAHPNAHAVKSPPVANTARFGTVGTMTEPALQRISMCCTLHLPVEREIETVFHYTTLTAFTGIVGGGFIRAINVNHVRDPDAARTEPTHAMELFRNYLDTLSTNGEWRRRVAEVALGILDRIQDMVGDPTSYIACFSRVDCPPSQWHKRRPICDGLANANDRFDVAIRFDLNALYWLCQEKFGTTVEVGGAPLPVPNGYPRVVSYTVDEQRAVFNRWLEDCRTKALNSETTALQLVQIAHQIAPAFKPSKFSWEDEVRVQVYGNRVTNPRGAAPYVEIPIRGTLQCGREAVAVIGVRVGSEVCQDDFDTLQTTLDNAGFHGVPLTRDIEDELVV